uniref:Aggrecan core protein n=1 Tax=Magallana gigas TaxID=29159 RepID=K1QQI2_MAGGI
MVVCDLAVIVLWCLVSLGGCELPGLVFYGKRSDPLFTYSTLSPSGIQQCVRACFLDRACNSVNFDRSQLTCHLNSRENLTKDCSQNNCGQEESCINLKNGSTCIKTDIHTNLTEYWIGLSDREVEGAFRWVDGQSVGFSNWGDNQPNNRDVNCVSNGTFEADCTVIRKNGRWADDCCGDSKAFICEIV